VIESIDDFKDKISHESDFEEDYNNAQEIADLNFANFGKAEENKGSELKTKKQIYEQIIKKSKFMKYEKQKQKENDDDLLEQLNNNFPEINKLLKFRDKDK